VKRAFWASFHENWAYKSPQKIFHLFLSGTLIIFKTVFHLTNFVSDLILESKWQKLLVGTHGKLSGLGTKGNATKKNMLQMMTFAYC
jgi:hypothetical protein